MCQAAGPTIIRLSPFSYARKVPAKKKKREAGAFSPVDIESVGLHKGATAAPHFSGKEREGEFSLKGAVTPLDTADVKLEMIFAILL